MKKILYLLFSFIFFYGNSQQTVGLFFNSAESFNGYTLFSPMPWTSTYLIDNCGYEVHQWQSTYKPGLSVYLLPDGTLLRTGQLDPSSFAAGGHGGMIERFDWDSNIIWSYQLSDTVQCQHHDIEYLPNGNILAIAWENWPISQVIDAGRNPANTGTAFWPDKIVEIEPVGTSGGTIVWEWHSKDHLIQDFDSTKNFYGIVSDHPELIDINYTTSTSSDWLHFNSVDYNPQLDQILISCHNMNEIWIIDHSTSTTEAASHSGGNSGKGGDLLFRWGNPEAYSRGTTTDEIFFGQHDAQWIESGLPDEGEIMVFNNGAGRTPLYSSIDVIVPPLDSNNTYVIDSILSYGPDTLFWQYTSDTITNFYSSGISGTQRLQNGNTFICEGQKGHFFEIDTNKNIVWKYVNPVSNAGPVSQETVTNIKNVFRATRLAPDFQGLSGHTLTPGNPIELNPYSYACNIFVGNNQHLQKDISFEIFPNPVNEILSIKTEKIFLHWEVSNILGEKLLKGEKTDFTNHFSINVTGLSTGIYFLTISGDNFSSVKKFIRSPLKIH